MKTETSDYELIKSAQQGEELAFQTLFNRYYLVSYKLAFRWMRNKQDAEDVAQESFVRVAKSIRNYKLESSFKTWLYRIVVNCCKDLKRTHARDKKQADEIKDINSLAQPVASPDSQMDQKALNKTLELLNPKAREAFVLVVFEDLTHAEAAQVLGCAETTVSWHIHWAKKKMKKVLSIEKVTV